MQTTTSMIPVKKSEAVKVKEAVLQIASEDQFTESERSDLMNVLTENPGAQRTIVRLSGQAVAMRGMIRDLDDEIRTLTRQLHETDLARQLQEAKRKRRAAMEFHAECEAQERGVWASLLHNFRKSTKLYRKLRAAAVVIGEGGDA